MYGFKGTDKYMKCKGFQYTLQTKYKHEGKIELCDSGFHLCKELNHVFEHYPFWSSNRYFVVKYGKNHIEGRDKLVTNSITFMVEITPEFILNCETESALKIHDFDFLYKNFHALLLWAGANGHLDVVKFLVNKGNANIEYSSGCACGYASENNHLEVVKFLVENGADIDIRDGCALRYASENGHLEIVKYLISVGANIHVYNDYPLRFAAIKGHLEIVKFLVENGANIHSFDDVIFTVVRNSEVLKYLKQQIKTCESVKDTNDTNKDLNQN